MGHDPRATALAAATCAAYGAHVVDYRRGLLAASRSGLARSSAEQLARALAGTPGGAAEARGAGVAVLTEEAGVMATWRADAYLLDHCRATGILNPRQCEAAEELARARGLCLPRPWARGSADAAPGDDASAAAEARYAQLLAAAPQGCRSALATLAMGEWPISAGMPGTLREGLNAVAAELKIP